MSTTQDLVNALKSELRAAGVTYADLADALGMSESSVKRVFAKSDMPLSRIDEMLRVLKMDFAELARKVADAQPLSRQLTVEQEAAVVADRRLLLLAICCLSQWSFEAMTQEYAFSDAECIKYLAQLDRLGIIELRPLNRYRLKVAKGFRWLPHGPVMTLLPRARRGRLPERRLRRRGRADHAGPRRDHAEPGGVAGRAAAPRRPGLRAGASRRAAAADEQRTPYTLLVGMRTWLFAAFRDLKRVPPPA